VKSIDCTACDVSPCSHGNCNCTCLPKEMYYNCSCDEGYIGVNCDQDINECMNGSIPSNICGDNGTCRNTNGSFRCEVSKFLMRLQQSLSTHAKISHLVTSLSTSRQQDVSALLVTSCQQVWNNLLITCNNLAEIIRLVTRLF
jgi:hypothetical protein